MGAIGIHYEHLLQALRIDEFVEGNPLAVRRPGRGASEAVWIGELDIMRSVGIGNMDCPPAAGTFQGKGELVSVWRPGWREGVPEQKPEFAPAVRG